MLLYIQSARMLTLCCGAAAASVHGPAVHSEHAGTSTLLTQWHTITIHVTVAAHVDNDKY